VSRGIEQARLRWERLAAEIHRHDRLYYQLAEPEISDEAYDAMLRDLDALESAHPELRTPDSPTQTVREGRDASFPPFVHESPMLSLTNTYSYEELDAFFARVGKDLGDESPQLWAVEPKVDGVALSLHFDEGRLAADSSTCRRTWPSR